MPSSGVLTYGDGVGVALVVDAEPPQALIGRAARVAILHPEVGRRGNDEKHEGGHAAECASPRQRVEHGVRERPASTVSNCGASRRHSGDGGITSFTDLPNARPSLCHIGPFRLLHHQIRF